MCCLASSWQLCFFLRRTRPIFLNGISYDTSQLCLLEKGGADDGHRGQSRTFHGTALGLVGLEDVFTVVADIAPDTFERPIKMQESELWQRENQYDKLLRVGSFLSNWNKSAPRSKNMVIKQLTCSQSGGARGPACCPGCGSFCRSLAGGRRRGVHRCGCAGESSGSASH